MPEKIEFIVIVKYSISPIKQDPRSQLTHTREHFEICKKSCSYSKETVKLLPKVASLY
jgi:hypothetical protein